MLSFGQQLAQLGMARSLAEINPKRTFHWGGNWFPYPDSRGPTEHDIEALVGRASAGNWIVTPDGPSALPFWRPIGRRQPDVGCRLAQEHLADMSADQLEAELRGLLDALWFRGDAERMSHGPHRVTIHKRYKYLPGGWYGMGTVFPETMVSASSPTGYPISAWAVALAWEASDWFALDIWRLPDGGVCVALPTRPIFGEEMRDLYRQAHRVAEMSRAGHLIWNRYRWRMSSQYSGEYWWDSCETPQGVISHRSALSTVV